MNKENYIFLPERSRKVTNTYLYNIKSGAKYRNLEYSLNIGYLQDLIEKQAFRCSLSGLPIFFSDTVECRKNQASLDRIDSSKGYIEGNVQWVDKNINNSKWDLDEKVFINFCCKIANNYRTKRLIEVEYREYPLCYKNEDSKWKGYGDISGTFWCWVRRGARNRNIEFSLTKEEGWNLYLSQNKLCALSGEPVGFSCPNKTTASLDRIDSDGPYVLENVHWVHRNVNQMKMHYPLWQFIMQCNMVLLFQNHKNLQTSFI